MFIVSVYTLIVGDCESHFVYPFKDADNAKKFFADNLTSARKTFPWGEEIDTDNGEINGEETEVNAHWESGDGDLYDMILAECDYCD